MTNIRTSKEVLARRIAKLGNDLGSLYHEVWNEWVGASMHWDLYRTLFMKDKERVDLLNEELGSFAGVFQNILEDHCILAICRMTDPQSGKYRQATIRAFSDVEPVELAAKVTAKIKEVIANSNNLRTHRDKRISHIELDKTSDRRAPLPRYQLKTVTDTLNGIHSILEAIALEKWGAGIGCSHEGEHDAEDLVACVLRSEKLKQLLNDALVNGQVKERIRLLPRRLRN